MQRALDYSRRFLALWRSSLTVRVLLTTASLSIVVAVAVSFATVTQVRDGLVEQKQNSSLTQAAVGFDVALRTASSIPLADTAAERASMVDAVVAAVSAPAGSSGEFEVLLLATSGKTPVGSPERGTNEISDQTIPLDMRTAIIEQQAKAWQIATVRFLDGREVPGIVVGAPLFLPGIGQYELYQIFPLQGEISTLEVMRNAIGWSGLLMIVSLIGVSLLLTRQVVQPIRKVAESAEKLSSGRLTERIAVRGQDDLARLAHSFNGMAASLQQQITSLEKLSQVQQRFVSDVSHELRTPLTTIRMASELLYANAETFDPANARAVELLQQQSERFETLLNDLLEISRLDAGTVKLEIDHVDMSALLLRVVDSLDSVASKLEVPVECVGTNAPVIVECDARRVERIVRNLVANAIEHTQKNLVTVAIAVSSSAVTVVVRDRGVGLQPGEQALVFNRFWRADPSRQRTLGGTGLGLSISLEDARVHGGWLDAAGEPGNGALFRMVLPLLHGSDVCEPAIECDLEVFDQWRATQ